LQRKTIGITVEIFMHRMRFPSPNRVKAPKEHRYFYQLGVFLRSSHYSVGMASVWVIRNCISSRNCSHAPDKFHFTCQHVKPSQQSSTFKCLISVVVFFT